MFKSFYALEKNTRIEYFKTSDDLRAEIISMSAEDIAAGKRELMLLSNILALPGEVDMEDFKAPPLYTVDPDGTANIQVSGILSTQVDWCAAYFNEATTTYGFIRAAALAADEDPEVKKIRFIVSTPGGIVTDLDFTSQVIWNIQKPTETIGFGMVASAGIYLFSQTDKIISGDPATFWGSIGVAVSYIDRSKADKAAGIQRVDLASDDAPDKRPDLSTDEGQQVLIKELNDLHKIFVGRVATGRGVTPEFVNKNFGRGGVLIAEDALSVGLIDQINNQVQATEPVKKSVQRSSAKQESKKEENMDLNKLLAENPEAKEEYKALIKAEFKKGADSVQATIDAMVPFMNGDYPEKVKAQIPKVFGGEITAEVFKMGVAMFDMGSEDDKSKAAKDEQKPDTPAAQSQKSTDGIIRNAEDEAQAIADLKGEV